MVNLSQLLSGKVDKEILLSKIKYDTLMVEKQDGTSCFWESMFRV